MKIVFWGNGERGVSCLNSLVEKGYAIDLVVAAEDAGTNTRQFRDAAEKHGCKIITPADPNDEVTENTLRELRADLFILAGYGKIIKQNIIEIPRVMCLNLHAGKLPEYRGSSPLNWSLINGEHSFTISVIRVDAGVDTGDVLAEKSFDIFDKTTIRDLHNITNREYPALLLRVIGDIESDKLRPKKQNPDRAGYFPLRFPEDGFILWDCETADGIHNKIRALTTPYPCAFSFFNGQRVNLIASQLLEQDFFGEPGRIYKIKDDGLIICASDRALKITEAVITDTGAPLRSVVKRYDQLSTLRLMALEHFSRTR